MNSYGLRLMSSTRRPDASIASRYPSSCAAPPMHDAHRSASQTIEPLSCCSLTMSAIASRPPGRSTRAASAKTASFWGERLITPLEITQSALSSSTGRRSIRPARTSAWSATRQCVAFIAAAASRPETSSDPSRLTRRERASPRPMWRTRPPLQRRPARRPGRCRQLERAVWRAQPAVGVRGELRAVAPDVLVVGLLDAGNAHSFRTVRDRHSGHGVALGRYGQLDGHGTTMGTPSRRRAGPATSVEQLLADARAGSERLTPEQAHAAMTAGALLV